MRIFGLGIPELVIIILIICIIFGPSLFKKLGGRAKKTVEGAKKGIEDGAKAAGKEVDLENVRKDDVLDKVEGLQDKMEVKLDEMNAEEDPEAKEARKAERVEKIRSAADALENLDDSKGQS